MKTSESISKIVPALLDAQKAITFSVKNAANPHFRSTYADLGSVIESIKGPLNDAGIVFVQSMSPSDDGMLHLTTRLFHESGEWLEDEAICPIPKADPQGLGSAVTYVRRYSLSAFTGLYQDDDDGNAASLPAKRPDIAAIKKAMEGAPDLKTLQGHFRAAWQMLVGDDQEEAKKSYDKRKAELEKKQAIEQQEQSNG